ncbi:PAX3- and PAX7-binding protein 1-like [Uloborus diversus]|uniref:PAX3- and PAX7-binding protein 1-like n=1 Tax=Uloborus diversus TaxID=327109 RepID=UPI0024097691|nr:PAX3- and PAX7-binding protein 1-like [Uloborus diversus]
MGLFKKPNRKFRQREVRNDSDEESTTSEAVLNKEKSLNTELKDKASTVEAECVASVSTGTGNSSGIALKEKDEKIDTSIPKATKLLSFHDEEDDTEVFKLKKSNYSRRLAKQRERERKKKEESLQVASRFQEGPTDVKSKGRNENKAESSSKEPWNILAGKDAEDMEVDSDEEKEKSHPFKNVLQSGVIPDAATIYAMKKHRQMAREMGDFIPVEDPEKSEDGKSRLVREDDNDRSDDDDDDEPSRLSFTVNTGAVERQKIRETFLSLQDGSTNELENEDAAELDRWEREQIRKGVGVVQVGSTESATVTETPVFTYPPIGIENIQPFDTNANQPQFPMSNQRLDALLKKNETVLTTSDIKARLEERLSALKTLYKAHVQEQLNCEKELVENNELIKKLEREAPERARNFSLYQQMSGYVKDLVECLDLKVAHLELLDSKMMDLYKSRAQKFSSRRQQDVRDQSDEFSALSSEILKGVSAEFLNEKNTCSDELKLRRAAEREGRRMRRRKHREKMMLIVKHQDGMSSDDEEPDLEVIRFKKIRETILDEANTIFEDVVEEFGTLEGVMSNFEKWKAEHHESYSEAFVPLCLPKIFGTFVRLALLDWNPLEEERNFEKTTWYRQLVFYGYFNRSDREDNSVDSDANLLPGIMEKIVIPKVTGFIQNVWDPLSQKQTIRLVELIKDLSGNYPTINGKSKQFQSCLKAVTSRIYKALDDDIFIPLYPKELLESRSLGASDFFQRQFWTSVKFLQNILMWDGIIAEQPMQHMALASLLNRYLMMGLHTSIMMRDTLDKCKVIVASLPKNWFKSPRKEITLPLLKQFCSYLLKFADAYSSQCMKKGHLEDDTKDVVKDIVQLLLTVNYRDEAVSLAKKYSVSSFKNG